jgi:fumarate hydratase class II
VTALGPMIGYDKASAIAHKANDEGLTLKEAALQSSDIDEERFDDVVDPRTMVGHGVGGSLRPDVGPGLHCDGRPNENALCMSAH